MIKTTVKFNNKGLDKLKKKLKKIEELDGKTITLNTNYTNEEFDKMTDYEKEQIIDEVTNDWLKKKFKEIWK